jgi:protein-disulfide isomerase
MHDAIYKYQDSLSGPFLVQLAKTFGLSTAELEEALENKTYEPKVKKDFIGGVRSGVNGTPTFFINNQRYNGDYDLEGLTHAIELEIGTSMSF